MRKIKEILRQAVGLGRSQRRIGEALGLSQSAVQKVLARARGAGLGWPLPEGWGERELEGRLYGGRRGRRWERDEPDYAWVREQLATYRHVTQEQLWQEYAEGAERPYSYSRFCALYKAWLGRQDAVLAQGQRAGERLYLDYAGPTVAVQAVAGRWEAAVFVATLGLSSYTYAEASRGQGLRHWLGSHVRALEYFGGSAAVWVPDNLRSAVTRADRYEPEVNRSYQELAAHYGAAVEPARPGKPRDKAKVEAAVLGVERRVLAPLRERRFGSLGELNGAMRPLLEAYNERPFQRREGSRRSEYERWERPALLALPERRYEYAEWGRARVGRDYHVLVEGHYYSAPWRLLGRRVDVRLTETGVELLERGERVAAHRRSWERGGYTTQDKHRPRAHREHLGWSEERVAAWTRQAGPRTQELVRQLLGPRGAPQRRQQAVLGIARLGQRYGEERLEAAAARALHFGTVSYRSVKSILQRGLDRLGAGEAAPRREPPQHANVRGAEYYGGARETENEEHGDEVKTLGKEKGK